MAVRVFHRDEADTRLAMVAQDARLVVWPGVGAWDANMNYVRMQPGEENVPHAHGESEDTIFILDGEGTIRNLDAGVEHAFRAGQVVFVPVGVRHQVVGDRGVLVESVGGPCPADVAGLRKAGLIGEDAASTRP
jgi:quercetin dioxygenase-like cupin family protein